MPLPFLIPLITAAASAGGTILQNKANAREAQKNRDFQERMSSTAAQRAQEDFRKAGLNPALAYQHTSSTPSGSTAQFDNPAEKGIHSALAARRMQMELRQADENIKSTIAQTRMYRALGDKANTEVTNLDKELEFKTAFQPYELRQRELTNLLTAAALPAAKNEAAWQSKLGIMAPALNTLLNSGKSLTQILSGLKK
jgi:hypothetical protein